MQIDGNIKLGGPRENGPEFSIVEKAAARQAVDNGAFEFEFGDRPFQFIGRGFGIWSWQCSEAGESVGMKRDPIVQNVVSLVCQGDRQVRLEDLRSRLHVRNDLNIDPRFIHLTYSSVSEIFKPARGMHER